MTHLAELEVQPLSRADAEAIASWRYPGAYAFYNRSDERESDSVSLMLDPRNGFYAVRGPLGLVGFCSFGADARVPGGTYDDEALDVGAGMDPTFVGNGHGRSFLDAVVTYATFRMKAAALRVTIASWNERALCAARNVGFHPAATFQSTGGIDFTILTRQAER